MEWLDVVLLSRLQFTYTIIVHYFFVPFTIGMAAVIAYMEFKYWRTNEAVYDRMARFWTKLFLVNFAVGVATGITMEFQFGTNWAAYSRYVGDIFGAPLAAEGVFAFFLESTFVGLLVFGRDKISHGMRAFAALMVALGTTLSSFWILAANSWMQTPAGYVINEELGRAEMTSFYDVIFNPSTVVRLLHVLQGAYLTAAFFIMAISAYYLLRKRNISIAKESMKIAIILALVVSVTQILTGHSHAVLVAETQPAKLAAFEMHWETKANAPLILMGIPDYENERNKFEIGIPSGLSILAYNSPSGVVTGLKDIPVDERPNIVGNFLAFHIMVGIGTIFVAWTIFLFVLMRKNKLYDNELMLKLMFFALPLPYLANTFGWILTEWGRQPWVVYGVLKTADAVSDLSRVEMFISLALFISVYTFLMYLMVHLMKRAVRSFDDEADNESSNRIEPTKEVAL